MKTPTSDEKKIARFIARRGVTPCPPAYLEPVRCAVPSAALRHYQGHQFKPWNKRNPKK